MSVRWRTKINKLPEIATITQGMNGKKVKVGALQGEHAWL